MKVKDNTFYRKQLVTEAIPLRAQFKDLPTATEDLLKFEGGLNPTNYVISGQVPSFPNYGEYILSGAMLRTYISGVTMETTPSLPEMQLYRFKPEQTIKEGGMSLAHLSGNTAYEEVGHKISVYTASMGADNVLMEEFFDGSDKSLGEIIMLGKIGTSVANQKDAYVTPKDGADTVWSGGENYGFGGGRDNVQKNLKDFFTEPKYGPKVFIAPVKKNKPTGLWTARDDNRPNKWSVYVPYWKWKDVKNVIKFDSAAPAETNENAESEATPNNTIFSNFYSTRPLNNPYSSDENSPVLMSEVTLSSDKTETGGQALRMYHLWDYSDQNPNIEKLLIASGQASPQVARAEIHNIPVPLPNTYGNGNKTAATAGLKAATVPQIDVSMNISKLGICPNFTWVTGATANGTGGTVFASGNTEIPWANKEVTTASGGSWYLYSGMAISEGHGVRSLDLRCAAITFSNYLPTSDSPTLSTFLASGMKTAYQNKDDYTGGGIVGGILFQTYGDENVYASPIPVTKMGKSDFNLASALESRILANGGAMILSGSDTNTSGQKVGAIGMDNFYQMVTDDFNVRNVSNHNPRCVRLGMNKFFKMKFCIDVTQQVSQGILCGSQDNPYDADSTNHPGSAIRVYFMDAEKNVPPAEPSESNDYEDIPYIDIPFTAVDADQSSLEGKLSGSTDAIVSGTYTLSGALNEGSYGSNFPLNMTFWAQNYRYYTATAGTQGADGYYTGSTADAPWFSGSINGDNDYFSSGTAMETEIFVDAISFKNWGYDITNASATAGTLSRNIKVKPENIFSPLYGMVSGTANNYSTAFSTGKWLYGNVTGSLQQTPIGGPIMLGFNEKEYLPYTISGGLATGGAYASGGVGYLLWNNFGTSQFGALDRFIPGEYGADAYNQYGLISVSSTNNMLNVYGGQVLATAVNATSSDPDAISGARFPITAGSGTQSGLYFATGTNSTLSTDGMTQKGYAKLMVSGTDWSNWYKRENIFASTKIIGVGEPDGEEPQTIRVADPEIFNTKDKDEEYIIYRIGELLGSDDSAIGAGTNSLKLTDLTGDLATFDSSISSLAQQKYLSQLWISPKKYWITMLQNGGVDSVTPRTYESICMVQETPSSGSTTQTGSTYNEYEYSYDTSLVTTLGQSALRVNPWVVEPDSEQTVLSINTDYGYGSYEADSAEGGQLSKATAKQQSWLEFNFDKIVNDEDISPNNSIIYSMQLADNVSDRTVTIYGDDHSDTDYTPHFIWSFYDPLPVAKTLAVNPAFNPIAENVDLYNIQKENLNAVKFTWEEDAEDVWYRHLMISDKNIPHKYHGCSMHIGFNDTVTGAGYSTNPSAHPPGPEATNYTKASGTARVKTSISGTGISQVINGLQGYTQSCSAAGYVTAAHPGVAGAFNGLQRYAASIHIVTPTGGATTSGMCIISQGSGAATGMDIFLNADGQVVLRQANKTISGTTILPYDGETPTNITWKYSSGSNSGKDLELYVNGVLEGFESEVDRVYGSDLLMFGRANDGASGSSATSSGTAFTGLMEEFVLYELNDSTNDTVFVNDVVVVDSANEYIYSTADLLDTVSSKPVTHQARMFVYDYHNIRGLSREQVCSTNQTSWRVTQP